MNSRAALGDAMPTGGRRIVWNVLMVAATLIASFASIWGMGDKVLPGGFPIGKVALVALFALLILGVISFLRKNSTRVAT